MLKILLRDLDASMVSAWEAVFVDAYEVDVSCGPIFDVRADAIVSPANSFGYMDGGIDLVYSRHFGWNLQERLQALLSERHDGELPVGQAVVVPTGHTAIPFLVSAPTMRVPANIERTVNAYLAFRAALVAVLDHNRNGGTPIASLLCPGLGTGVGGMPPARAARQMRNAYDAIVRGEGRRERKVVKIWERHQEMLD